MRRPKPQKERTPFDELRILIRKGRLFDVQAWIADGKALVEPESRKQQALEAAVESGFHSMVEVLARVWPNPESLNDAFSRAVNQRRIDLVWLLLEHGADMKSVSLGCIAECFDKELMRYYLDRWDSVGTCDGLTDIVTAKAYPLIGLIREFAPRIPNHKAQLGAALNHFIDQGSLKWVSLAMWMGADPRLPAPTGLDDDSDPDEWMTPLAYGLLNASVPALKLIKPSAERDDLNALLGSVSYWRDEGYDVAEYLLGLGANVNNKGNGGSSIIDGLLRPGFEVSYSGISRTSVSVYRLESWFKRGARWVPDSDEAIREARSSVYGLSAYDTVRVMKVLAPATAKETLLRLFNTPKMCTQLDWKPAALREKIEEIYRPRVEKAEIVKPFVLPDETTFKQMKPHIVEARSCELSRRELYEKVWSQSGVALGNELGISSVGLAKICKSYKIPIPGRGYWAKRYNRHKVRQKQLGSPDWNPNIEISTYGGAPPIANEELRAQVQTLIEGFSKKGLTIEVVCDTSNLHPLLEGQEAASGENAARPAVKLPEFDPRRGGASHEGPEFAEGFRKRAARAMDALVRLLEAHDFGLGVVADKYAAGRPVALLFEQQIPFELRGEGERLRLDIYGRTFGMRSTWRDGKSRYLESYFAEFAATLAYVAALSKCAADRERA